VAVRARELESRVVDARSRRIRHPALERTLFRRLDGDDTGDAAGLLGQVEGLLRFAAAEWRLARRRIAEHTAELRSLRETVAALAARVELVEARVQAQATASSAHVVLLSRPAGYAFVPCEGPPPAPGETIEHDGASFRVLRHGGRSPFPRDARPCVLALPA
jgi:hypothetical protein